MILSYCFQGKPAKWRDFHSATAVGTNMYIFGGRGRSARIMCRFIKFTLHALSNVQFTVLTVIKSENAKSYGQLFYMHLDVMVKHQASQFHKMIIVFVLLTCVVNILLIL